MDRDPPARPGVADPHNGIVKGLNIQSLLEPVMAYPPLLPTHEERVSFKPVMAHPPLLPTHEERVSFKPVMAYALAADP
jgi:hypothetical protein